MTTNPTFIGCPAWLFHQLQVRFRTSLEYRKANGDLGHLARQRGAERLMSDRPIDLYGFAKNRYSMLYLAWQSEFHSHPDGAIPPAFDTWMDSRFLIGHRSSEIFRNGAAVFELRHGSTYEIRDADGKLRVFRCQLDNGFPHISFMDPDAGQVFPWITMPGVFSQAELFSLRELP